MNLTKSILVVEDDDDAVVLMRYALQRAGIENPLQVVNNGDAAIHYLSEKTGAVVGFVLLDLQLPSKSGQEVLYWIRSQAHLSHVVVIVATTSYQEADVRTCNLLGANAFIVKPLGLDEFVDLLRAFKEFWIEYHQFPPAGGKL